MIKVTELSENEIEEIGEAFADYNYADGEKGMSFLYNGMDSVKEYICGYVRAMLAGGCLFSTSDKHEAFVAYKFSKDNILAVYQPVFLLFCVLSQTQLKLHHKL